MTEFDINEEYVSKYEPHIVGSAQHEELWVPAEKLSEFNLQIVAPIRISHAFYGEQYIGKNNKMEDASYIEQFILFRNLKNYNLMDFSYSIQESWKAVAFNYIAWSNYDYTQDIEEIEKKSLLQEIKEILIQNKKWFFAF